MMMAAINRFSFPIAIYLLCLLAYPTPILSIDMDDDDDPFWIAEIHYRYLIETEIDTMTKETLAIIEEICLESIFLRFEETYTSGLINNEEKKPFSITEMDSFPMDQLNDGKCIQSQNNAKSCYIIDGAMTIRVHDQTAQNAISSFYDELEEVINDQETFQSILPQDSIIFYIKSMAENNIIQSDNNKKSEINLALLCSVVVGGFLSVIFALWGLSCNEQSKGTTTRHRTRTRTTTTTTTKPQQRSGRLGIASANPYWLELASTSSSMSFESTILPSKFVDSLSLCGSNVSDLSDDQSNDSGGEGEGENRTNATTLEIIDEEKGVLTHSSSKRLVDI